jgi:hypothetical protein
MEQVHCSDLSYGKYQQKLQRVAEYQQLHLKIKKQSFALHTNGLDTHNKHRLKIEYWTCIYIKDATLKTWQAKNRSHKTSTQITSVTMYC